MKKKKIPMRKCTGCGEAKPKKDLIRVVKTTEGELLVDLTGKVNGRGAYICKSINCYDEAIKTNRIARNLEVSINDELVEELRKVVEEASK